MADTKKTLVVIYGRDGEWMRAVAAQLNANEKLAAYEFRSASELTEEARRNGRGLEKTVGAMFKEIGFQKGTLITPAEAPNPKHEGAANEGPANIQRAVRAPASLIEVRGAISQTPQEFAEAVEKLCTSGTVSRQRLVNGLSPIKRPCVVAQADGTLDDAERKALSDATAALDDKLRKQRQFGGR